MGLCSGKPVDAAAPAAGAAPGAAASGECDEATVKQLHSVIRWHKPLDVISEHLDKNPSLVNASNPSTGNISIHLAAQNGHLDIVKLLIERKVNVNAQNNTGTTALHMAKEYDYFWTCKALIAAGADPELENKDGSKAKAGIEGGKAEFDWVSAVSDAHTPEHLEAAYNLIVEHKAELPKDKLAYAILTKKKQERNGLWTPEFNKKYMSFVRALN